MSNIVSDSLKDNLYHTLKMGDDMIKQYGNKQVKISFYFDKTGKKLKDILEDCFRTEIRNEQILTGGNSNDLQKNHNDAIMQS